MTTTVMMLLMAIIPGDANVYDDFNINHEEDSNDECILVNSSTKERND